MIDLMLCVNDSNGNVTDQCLGLEIWIDDTEAAIELECELSFLEIPDGLIQIENAVYPDTSRGTMVGNVFWNSYRITTEDGIALCNRLKFNPMHNLLAGWTPLYDKWESAELFDVDDFKVEPEQIDTTPICLACGVKMVWTGDEREIELEGGELTVSESIYRCCNPDCEED